MNNQPEYHLQCQVVSWIELQHPKVVFCATLGGVHQTILQGNRLKKQGYRKGIPDLLIFDQNLMHVGLALEFKAGKNKPSEHQKEWHIKLNERGWQVHTVWDFDSAVKIINHYLYLKQDF
jgi:hypothetical protein